MMSTKPNQNRQGKYFIATTQQPTVYYLKIYNFITNNFLSGERATQQILKRNNKYQLQIFSLRKGPKTDLKTKVKSIRSIQCGMDNQTTRDKQPVSKKRFKVSQRKSNISHVVLEEEEEGRILSLLLQLEILDKKDKLSCFDEQTVATLSADDYDNLEGNIQSGDESERAEGSDSEQSTCSDDNGHTSFLSDGVKRKLIRKLIRDDRRIQSEIALEKSVARSEMKARKADNFRASINQANQAEIQHKLRIDDVPLRIQISIEKNKAKTKVLVVDRAIGVNALIKQCRDKLQASKRIGLLRVLPGGEELNDDMLLTLKNDVQLCLCTGSPTLITPDACDASVPLDRLIAPDGEVASFDSKESVINALPKTASEDEASILLLSQPQAQGTLEVKIEEQREEGISPDEKQDKPETSIGHNFDSILGQRVPDEAVSATMRVHRTHVLRSTSYTTSILPVREALPMYSSSNIFLNMLNENNAMIVVGDTGCGKVEQLQSNTQYLHNSDNFVL